MHRDTKIGLALGILLIGTVGAFCFRNHPVPGPDPLKFAYSEQVNAVLESRSIKPYLDAASTASADPAHAQETEFVQHFTSRHYPARKEILYTGSQPPPDPIEIQSTEGKKVSEKFRVNHQMSLQKNRAVDARTQAEKSSQKTARSSAIFYKIQPGDTLSDLAIKYLGSVARANELFEANRKTLKSPDRLQVGMELRIPTRTRDLQKLPPTSHLPDRIAINPKSE